YPLQGGWDFENLDDDPALEIIQAERLTDNRGCEFSSRLTFQWNNVSLQYELQETVYEYADTAVCSLRQAHYAMIDLDFQAAIDHYERLLTFQPSDAELDMWQYARVRLAAAYALNGQKDEAAALLDQLKRETYASGLVGEFIESAYNAFSSGQ